MPGRDIAALLQAEPTARALGAATGPAHQTDRREWLGQLIAAGDTVLSEGRAALWLHDAGSGRLRLAFPECDAPPMAARDGLAAACLAGRSDLQVNDASAEAGFRASADRACGLRTRSLLSLPLVGHDGEALGVLQLLRPGIGPPPESDLRLMRALATQCQLAMHQVQLTDRLRENLRLEEEVEVAREIQFSTLPETMPAVPGYEVHGCFHPARHAGGDLFDLVMLEDRLFILMGKTEPDGEDRHRQQSMILVPMDTPGVEVLRNIPCLNHVSPEGHSEVVFRNVRVPVGNLLGAEGDGFMMAQARLGPGRIHHCMRAIGMAELCLELMVARSRERKTFGRYLYQHGSIAEWIARSRIEIEQARLLVLKTAALIDGGGSRAARKEISMIKVIAAGLLTSIADRAIQVFGAMGLSPDTPLADLYTAGRALRFADGPDEVHLQTIARLEAREQQDRLLAVMRYLEPVDSEPQGRDR